MNTKERIYEKLLYVLENDRVFLMPELNLINLSRLLHTNTTYLSNIINQQLGCNFRTLLMRYRIQYACQLLDSEPVVMPQLPARCGFSSKSAFYEAFQIIQGMNPRQYLQRKSPK